jgi:hypothetical protein
MYSKHKNGEQINNMNHKILSLVSLTIIILISSPVLALGNHHSKKENKNQPGVEVEVEIEGDNNHNKSKSNSQVRVKGNNEVGRPASVFVDACSSGASASAVGAGATFGKGNPACVWMALSGAAYNQGHENLAREYLVKAQETLDRQNNALVRYLQYIPLIGSWF